MMPSTSVEDILADVERDAVDTYGRHLRDLGGFTSKDRDREQNVLSADPSVETSWIYEHARVILQQRHDELFGQFASRASSRETKGWIKELAKSQMRNTGSVVQNGRLLLRSDFCMLIAPTQRQQWMRLSIAVGGKLAATSRHPNMDSCRTQKERAASMVLGSTFGPDIAAQFYREVHGLDARFEPAHTYYPSVWRVIFDLGEVDQSAHEARVESGRKRKIREALLDGPLRKQALGDRRVICAQLARRFSQVVPSFGGAEPVAVRVCDFLGLEQFQRTLAFRQPAPVGKRLR